MDPIGPSPRTTLVILLGASNWPHSTLRGSLAFARSAKEIQAYFCDPHQFGLPSENWLDLFDKKQNSPNQVDQAICKFLEARVRALQRMGTPVRDFLFYYIGHGLFTTGSDHTYHLALRCTRDKSIRLSALPIAALAETLKTRIGNVRQIVILDCCFSAEAFKYMQGAPDQTAFQQTMHAFKTTEKKEGFPRKGTALLCSSGHEEPSFILRDESGTIFSSALVKALSRGNEHQLEKTHLSLSNVKDLIKEVLESFTEENTPQPWLGSPDQREGDVANVPLFPNPTATQLAVQALSPNLSTRPTLLNNLGLGLLDRYARTRDLADLETAITTSQQAVQATPPSSPKWPEHLSNLGMGSAPDTLTPEI